MQNQTTSFDSLTPIIRRRRDAALDREEGLALLGRILAVVLVVAVAAVTLVLILRLRKRPPTFS